MYYTCSLYWLATTNLTHFELYNFKAKYQKFWKSKAVFVSNRRAFLSTSDYVHCLVWGPVWGDPYCKISLQYNVSRQLMFNQINNITTFSVFFPSLDRSSKGPVPNCYRTLPNTCLDLFQIQQNLSFS